MNNKILLEWIKNIYKDLDILLSVCTGAFIIGKAGLLKGLNATTHHLSYEEFESTFPDTILIKDKKFVDNGKIITSAGISAGINASLYIIDKLFGDNLGKITAEHMEYDI